MIRTSSFSFAAVLALTAPLSPLTAQTTFEACRVPDVGAIYMINVAGAPAACLAPSHVAFSWTEGGIPGAGSITSNEIADGTIVEADIAIDGVTGASIAPDAVGSTEILDGSVGSVDLASNAVGTSEILDGAVTLAKLNGGVNLGFTTITRRQTTPGVNLPAALSTFVPVACLAGETVTGGGGVNQNATGVYLKQSYPSGTGWQVTYQNTTGSAATGYAYAMCAS
jgi:hypothetical protein